MQIKINGIDMKNGDGPSGHLVAFGPFLLDRRRRELSRNGAPTRIGSRAFDLLMALVDRAGEVVSHGELVALVWPQTVVEVSSLRIQLKALRTALGDDAVSPTYIVSVSGRGYMFVAPTTAVAQAVKPENTATTSSPINNLPGRLTRIIGRDEVVRRLAMQLRHRRLMTIVGHGGVGKTTVAIAVANQLANDYADGVLFVDLSPLTQAQHVASAIGSSLGIPISSDDSLPILGARLAGKNLLIVLDNCEHVVESAAKVAEGLLKQLPNLSILATSREHLNVDGEWIHHLGPLSFPPADAELQAASTLAFPALELFMERARASVDTFELLEADAAVAGTLCRRLDGNPLAIEFVAARVGELGIRSVADHIGNLLELLKNGRRTSAPRHRTLRALVEWSYRLLTPDEQIVLAGISTLRAPFTLASAVAVVADGRMSNQSVVDCILALLRKSLLTTETSEQLQHYRLLEITRAFAAERLHAMSDHRNAHARHARLMIDAMYASHRDWERMPTALWISSYVGLISDVRAAIEWAFSAQGDLSIGIELTRFVLMSVQFPRLEGVRALAQEALSSFAQDTLIEAANKARMEARLRDILRSTTGAPPEIRSECQEAFEEAKRAGDTTAQIAALYEAWCGFFGNGDYPSAKQTAERSSAVAVEAQDHRAALHSDRMRAQSLHFLGDHAVAWELANRVLSHADVKLPLRYSSWVDRRVSMRIIMARILWMRGCADQATKVACEAVDIAAGDHEMSLSQAISFAACPIAIWCGDHALASALVDRLEVHAEKHALAHWQDWSVHFRRILYDLSEPHEHEIDYRMPFTDQPIDVKQRDMFATFADRYVTNEVIDRVDFGRVGWCQPEVLRRVAERMRATRERKGMATADALLKRSLFTALSQGALGWALRSAMSLSRLRVAEGSVSEARSLLLSVYDQIKEGFETSDMRAAKALLSSIQMKANATPTAQIFDIRRCEKHK